MIYLTYNDAPSGIYQSQVINVCNFVNQQFHCNLRLVALISIRGFFFQRKKIKSKLPNAIVIPMFPKHDNWRLNKYLLLILLMIIGKQSVWARGVFATTLALDLRKMNMVKKVVFDVRGAYAAEFKEYLNKVVHVKEDISLLERNAIQEADFRLAVSERLVEHWILEYQYNSSDHVIIPCTLNDEPQTIFASEKERLTFKQKLGFYPDDIVIVYAGSSADWQSMNLLNEFMMLQFNANKNMKLLLLSTVNIQGLDIGRRYTDRIVQRWVKPNEVTQFLQASDYGFLIRELSVTNQVASPTKFAEYLNAGLNIIISQHIGDFSNVVATNNCGVVVGDLKKIINFKKTTEEERFANKRLAKITFSKEVYGEQYQKITDAL